MTSGCKATAGGTSSSASGKVQNSSSKVWRITASGTMGRPEDEFPVHGRLLPAGDVHVHTAPDLAQENSERVEEVVALVPPFRYPRPDQYPIFNGGDTGSTVT